MLVFQVAVLNFSVSAQFALDSQSWVAQLNLDGGSLPKNLLSTRSVVFYSFDVKAEELKQVQVSFQRTGIDAVSYFQLDALTAGRDIMKAFASALLKREIENMVFIEKSESGYRISITNFNGTDDLIAPHQAAWSSTNKLLEENLKALYRSSANQQKKENLLINDVPEYEMTINPILGKRNEFYALDLKVDPLAVPKTGNELVDKELEQIFAGNYPLKYRLTEPGLSERELRKQGLLYVVCYVHTPGSVAKEVLGYDRSKSESALVSVTYPDSHEQLRNIPSHTPIYKFYFKHIDSGNVFLGTKWDADLTWEQALLNQIRGMKVELRLD